MQYFVLALEANYFGLCYTMRKHSLVADGRSCGESYDFLSSELPDSPNTLNLGMVCMILKDVVILIKDKNIMPRFFQIKATY